jgi:hypothetical protein
MQTQRSLFTCRIMPKEWGVLEINACWKWSPGVVILGMPHSQMQQHILKTLKQNYSSLSPKYAPV